MADTRQFTDHNEIGGVNVYLEDKKLAESPEQNTVATTDYVLLKDTDGVPHKISKANMMSVVKDALADLLKNNDLGTSVTNVPALNSSAFGSATVANLASVLGGMRGGTDVEGSDYDALPLNTVYNVKNGINGPIAAGEDVQVQVFTIGAQNFACQIARNKSNSTTMYIRFSWGTWGSTSATGWKKVSLENF